MLSFYRRPYFPCQLKLGIVDVALTAISIIITVIISALTMDRCRSRWQFIAIAAWKLDLSLTLGFLSMHAAIIAWNDRRGREYWEERRRNNPHSEALFFDFDD